MKKFTAILVAIVLALFVASCGGSDKKDEDKPDSGDSGDTDTTDSEADSGEEDDSCTIDSSFSKSDYSSYVLISGAGTIVANDNNATAADLLKVSFYDENYTDLNFASPYLIAVDFSEYGYGMGIDIESSATVYQEVIEQAYLLFYTVDAQAIIFQSDLDELESGEMGNFAPMINVGTQLGAYDSVAATYFTKTCTIGMNASEDGVNATGRFQYCMNGEIAAGQKIKLGIDAAVYNDPEGIEEGLAQQKQEVCSCRDCKVSGQMLTGCQQVDCPEDFCDVVNCGENAVCTATDKNPAGYFCKAICDAESEVYDDASNTCKCAEGYEKDKKTKKCVLKDACADVKCENTGDVCVVDATVADKGYRCEPKAECKAEDNEVLNDKTNKCDCKEGFEKDDNDKCVKDPCYKVTCETAGDVCVADAKEEKGYKCEKKAECKDADNEVLNEKTNTCDCKEGFERNANGKCESTAPVDPQKVLCEETEGTWAEGACNCGAGKVFDTTVGCKEDAPAGPTPEEELCDETGGSWAIDTCNCGEDKVWDDEDGCTDDDVFTPEELCGETGGTWDDGACICSGEDEEWNSEEGCVAI